MQIRVSSLNVCDEVALKNQRAILVRLPHVCNEAVKSASEL
jgi:hypothetical protein